MSATTAAPPQELIAVRPRQGYLVHVAVDDPKRRSQMGLGDMVFRGRALCRRRRMNFLIQGGPDKPVAVEKAFADTSYPCEACARKAGL